MQERLTRSAIGAFFDVHRGLGFGYREFIYALALEKDLLARGHTVERETPVLVYYRGEQLARQVVDMVVDNALIIEIKSGERLPPTARQQLFSYLRATDLEVGLLLHFGREPKFSRVICENRLKPRAPCSDHQPMPSE